MRFKISVIMPAYKLKSTIRESVVEVEEVLKRITDSYEIIVVDDGSNDGTYERVLNLAKKSDYIKVVRNLVNKGKGFSFMKGFLVSKGDIIVLLDADLEIPPYQVAVLLKALSKSDVAITSKWLPNSKVRVPLLRKVLSLSFNLLVRILTGLRFSDTQTGCKAFKREFLEEVLKKITVKRFAFDVELLLLATTNGYKVVEVPSYFTIICNSRIKLKEILRMFLDLLLISIRHRLLKYYKLG